MWRDPILRSAVLCDIDGTVALRGDRSPYDTMRVSEDQPNDDVIDHTRAVSRHRNSVNNERNNERLARGRRDITGQGRNLVDGARFAAHICRGPSSLEPICESSVNTADGQRITPLRRVTAFRRHICIEFDDGVRCNKVVPRQPAAVLLQNFVGFEAGLGEEPFDRRHAQFPTFFLLAVGR